jgi:HEAT repeat protein
MKEPAAAVEPPLEALIPAATDEANLAARFDAIRVLGSHASHDARVRDLLGDLANHDPHPQVRDAAAMLLGGGR